MKVLSVFALCAVLFFALTHARPYKDEDQLVLEQEDDDDALMQLDLADLLNDVIEERSEMQEEMDDEDDEDDEDDALVQVDLSELLGNAVEEEDELKEETGEEQFYKSLGTPGSNLYTRLLDFIKKYPSIKGILRRKLRGKLPYFFKG